MSKVKDFSCSHAASHIVSMIAGVVLALFFCVFLTANSADAAGPTCTVAQSGSPDYTTIQDAVNDTGCTTIDVAAGTYTENVIINRSLTLNGANQGNNPNTGSRVDESIIDGNPAINITGSNVVLDGFEITNGAYGIDIQASACGVVIADNIITSLSSTDSTAQGIYLVHGPDGVTIVHNLIEDISGKNSTKGVFIGDSTTTDASNAVVVDGNVFTDISSSDKGAYGVTINNGSSPVGTTKNYGLVVENNTFDNLSGSWVHAVGIEADAPNAIVAGNSFSNLNAAGSDGVAVWFENEDPSYASSKVNENNFNFGKKPSVAGIAVDPTITPNGSLDGTCNYWGSASGPGGVGSGNGALVTSLVTFSPLSKNLAPQGPCQ